VTQKYRKLGRTGLEVSAISLGTMTWGQQNTEAEAHAQIDFALDQGVNLIDTAEMYPVPPKAETQGRTEQYIGTWFKKTGKRDKWILATKVAGPARSPGQPKHLRDGNARFDRVNIEKAIDDSLRRLQTDHVDLYQLHWPDRTSNFFGTLGFEPAPDEDTVPIRETLEVLADLIKAGKVLHVGVSNETPWGVNRFLRLSEEHGLPRIASIQNPYSLVNRSYEIGLAEIGYKEDVGLLAYSPLAFGVLSGKYLGGARPAGARITLFERFSRYNHPLVEEATGRYVKLAKDNGLDPSQLALAFLLDQQFLASAIIGATTLEQLKTDIGAWDVTLSDEVKAAVQEIHRLFPNPVH
jgi:aryl-alcohol dehydrogenase-like predicted oxidoreductase